jgi:uncharacterized protein (TIGR00730 family)
MKKLKRICVFCGSNTGGHPAYGEAARQVARVLLERGMGLVYGGGNVGLMGIVADEVMAGGGEVIGVIPGFLKDLEVAHHGLTELRVVGSMHERKALMADLADGFVALPGGFGTFDELCEILTWTQLRIQVKPVGLLNVRGYFDHLLAQLDHSVSEGFLKAPHRGMLASAEAVEELFTLLEEQCHPDEWKCITEKVR